jgi:hypothetical protein
VPGADHTFSSHDQQQAVAAATVAWLQQSLAP